MEKLEAMVGLCLVSCWFRNVEGGYICIFSELHGLVDAREKEVLGGARSQKGLPGEPLVCCEENMRRVGLGTVVLFAYQKRIPIVTRFTDFIKCYRLMVYSWKELLLAQLVKRCP